MWPTSIMMDTVSVYYSFFLIYRGVDLNRNFGYKWGKVGLLENPQVKQQQNSELFR